MSKFCSNILEIIQDLSSSTSQLYANTKLIFYNASIDKKASNQSKSSHIDMNFRQSTTEITFQHVPVHQKCTRKMRKDGRLIFQLPTFAFLAPPTYYFLLRCICRYKMQLRREYIIPHRPERLGIPFHHFFALSNSFKTLHCCLD